MREVLGEKGLKHDYCEKIITCEENNCKYTANNIHRKRVLYYHVDGEMICEGKRCDYGLAVYEPSGEQKTFYLIELKSSGFAKAVTQIMATIQILEDVINSLNLRGEARIIMRNIHVPNITSSYFVELKKLIRKQYHGNTLKKQSGFTEDI